MVQLQFRSLLQHYFNFKLIYFIFTFTYLFFETGFPHVALAGLANIDQAVFELAGTCLVCLWFLSSRIPAVYLFLRQGLNTGKEDNLELLTLLPVPLESWDNKQEPPHLTCRMLGTEPSTCFLLGKNSTTWAVILPSPCPRQQNGYGN